MSELSEERRLIQSSAREFTREVVRPIADRLDPVKGEIPAELIEQMAELGYFGILIPEEYGGLGLGAFEYCLVAEELARGWMSVASLIARGNALIGSLKAMTPEQKTVYLPRMARGDFLGAFSLSEPDAGSDVANISCRATRVGDEWEISGNKYWCTFADGADFIMVFARTEKTVDPKAPHRGISAFMVEKPRGQLPEGVSGNTIPKIGYFGWSTWELAFDKCRVPAANLIGEEGRGFYLATAGLETARAHTAARSIGLAQAGLDDAVGYAQQRRQFGQAISSFQAIRFKIANMATKIEAARALMYSVCNKIDQGERCDKEASMVKLFASEMSERVTSEALQILGGGGYTTLNQVERHWRDARLTKIFEGTSEIQMRIISDHILGRIRDAS
ncbi:acyl-CoA dehydrogenase family protein [Bosea sp. (in: a-proteobacteria)]|jgi:alkylation response protein AidB-like acyl-CoA dehydrogenase|uniref:acyl-CoA dehydrogenase family protein n=1 Tax=Bosea sp. (in: a-proteobacteria) TaxID=1871050 RepID=UPI001AD26809|nr:acyl-CoA dehydrogenase family protein [Bosea sp. (in: a-proteobacteria)]MBN9440466.1 acyl-CoA dehydrogenase family protein [Bosea sp. (in: a-proteobacteria)]